jgi:hypothetical protein
MIFVADRYPTIKKEMYSGYKSNRKESYVVDIQKELAEIILRHCGFEVLHAEHYESDDIIYTLCMEYKSMFEKIFVHSGDGDMYFLVDDKVEVVPTASSDKWVTKENYERTVDSSAIVPYNSNTFLKFLYGCKSDTVPALDKNLAKKLYRELYTDFYFPLMGNKKFMRELIETYYPDALHQFDLIYPLDVEDLIVDFYKEADLVLVNCWGNIVKNRKFPIMDDVLKEVQDIVDSWFLNDTYSDYFEKVRKKNESMF